MENSKIEWTDHTFNPWIGCTKVSSGCSNCYAESMMDHRLQQVEWGDAGTRKRTSEANWKKPFLWNKQAEQEGVRRRVFCASLADVFEDREELVEWRAHLFDIIYATKHLDWLLLTKRPQNLRWMISHLNGYDPCDLQTDYDANFASDFPNVWLGTSVENQKTADERIPHLLQTPAAVRFLSCEPLLNFIDLIKVHPATMHGDPVDCEYDYLTDVGEPRIGWVICGGESGANARPMHPDWARSLRDQCKEADVPFFFKQWGEWQEGSSRVGKAKAGRLLDGVLHDDMPVVKTVGQ